MDPIQAMSIYGIILAICVIVYERIMYYMGYMKYSKKKDAVHATGEQNG